MGQRYRLPFKDNKNRSYEVRVYIEGYSGPVTELTGSREAFVVEGTDEDFIYEPIRTSSATMTVLSNELLLDLFSINNQYAPVKLYKGNKLMWTGFITPEQFTQPYKPKPDSISIDCISAIGTLENIKYEQQTSSGFISAWALLRHIISSANGGYESVYIPHVYASSQSGYNAVENVFENISLVEENFISEEMALNEVLEYWCRFFNWTCYDYEGSLYFIDADWTGDYLLYDAGLTTYGKVSPNTINLQSIGFAGGDHTLDVLPGYSKAFVRSVNNVFDELLENEDYNLLKIIGNTTTSRADQVEKKQFVLPMKWQPYYYDGNGNTLSSLPGDSTDINMKVCGAVLLRDAVVQGRLVGGVVTETTDTDWRWEDSIQLRSITDDKKVAFTSYNKPVIKISGVNSVWMYGAIAISGDARYTTGSGISIGTKEYDTSQKSYIKFQVRIGNHYWSGSSWVTSASTFDVEMEATEGSPDRRVKNTKTLEMPYEGITGYIIPLPDNSPLLGKLEITMYAIPWTINVVDGVDKTVYGIMFKNLNISYKRKEGIIDEGEDGDRVYENVVNESYMSELDEIEFGISSYNEDGATYSKALLGSDFLTSNLYSSVMGKQIRPEESMITRIINRYKATKIRLTQVIRNTDAIHPFTVLTDNSQLGKRFILQSGVWDYRGNKITLSMVENG